MATNEIDQAVKAVEVLERLGNKRFIPEAREKMHRANNLAQGLMLADERIDALTLAADILEDQNHHIGAALLRAIGKGQTRRTANNTFVVTTALPDNWGGWKGTK